MKPQPGGYKWWQETRTSPSLIEPTDVVSDFGATSSLARYLENWVGYWTELSCAAISGPWMKLALSA